MGFRVEARQVPVQSVSIFLLIKMAPRESDAVYTSFTPTLKVADKALDLPVVSDAVSEITKITAPIAPYFEEGIRIIKDKADESLLETIKDKVGSCVTSLDTLACDGLDQLISAVPSLRSATPDLVETTKETASNYVDMMEEYVASFGIAQFGIRLVDTGLAVLESPLSLVSTRICSKVQHVRRHLRAVRRAGAKRAGHPCKVGPVLLQVANMFSLNFMLGFLGIQLVGADEEPVASSPKKETSSGPLGKVLEEEDSEMDPDYVLDSEESEDSLEYRSETELEELEDCPTTPNCAKVEHKTKKITKEVEEESSEDGSEVCEVEELEECPTTPNCPKVEHKIIKKVPYEKESSSEADSEEEDVLCNTPLCAKVEHTKVADVEEIEELSDGATGLDEVDDEFEEISEVECRTPQCVKDEHEGRRFQQAESQSDSQEEEE